MNFIKRAWASVSRRKGKSIILFAVVFLLGNVIAGAISIQQSTENVENNIKKSLGASATITDNWEETEKYWSENPEVEHLETATNSLKLLEEVAALPYVDYFDYSESDYIQTRNFKQVKLEENGTTSYGPGSFENMFSIYGTNSTEIADVKKGKIKIVDGSSFSEEELESGKQVVVISKKLAEQSNVSVGDKLIIDRSDSDQMYSSGEVDPEATPNIYSKDMVVEVIGLFDVVVSEKKKDNAEATSGGGVDQYEIESQYNTLYMGNKAAISSRQEYYKALVADEPDFFDADTEKMMLDQGEYKYYQPFYMLKNPEDVEAFRSEAEALLTKYDKVVLSTDQYDAVAGPLEGMSKISGYVLYVAVGASLFIVTLVILLFLRDRKHELGVYLSLGEKRMKVVGQIVMEVMMISLVAITLSVFTGNIIADSLSGSLISAQETTSEEDMMSGGMDDWALQQLSNNTIDQKDVIEAYEVNLSAGYIITFYIVGTLTILLSTVVPLIYIMRLNPKKIMM